jgi:hypothetical protein
MNTLNYLKAKSTNTILILTIVFLQTGNSFTFSQETKSLFGTGKKSGFVWGMELNALSIQHELGTLYGIYAGALYAHTTLIAVSGALNITHPTINYGYIGLMVQYTHKPDNLLHISGKLTIGTGTVKNYEQEKSSTFDNFGNISGAVFYFIEPGLNGEINLGAKTRLVLGIGYRLVNGINTSSEYIASTHVTDHDMSGISISAGVKFGLY